MKFFLGGENEQRGKVGTELAQSTSPYVMYIQFSTRTCFFSVILTTWQCFGGSFFENLLMSHLFGWMKSQRILGQFGICV